MQNLIGFKNSDKIIRINFACNCQNRPKYMPEYLSNIDFLDECKFRLNGSVKTKKYDIFWTGRAIGGGKHFQQPERNATVLKFKVLD